MVPPVITINFAGNLTEQGGPAYRIGDHDHLLPNGYYTNDSRQQEHWIYINITVNGTGSNPNIVALHWCQQSGLITTWNNNTWLFIQTGTTGKPYEFYYEFNSKGNISIQGGSSWYSFDVFANDQSGLQSLQRWEKNGLGYSVIRRYIQLGCTPQNISYSPFYVWDYTSGSGIYGLGDYGQPDDLHHDQGVAFNSNDTGYINSTIPRDPLQFRRCGAFVGLWFEDSVCIEPIRLRNIYFHFWWSTNNDVLNKLGWKKNRLIPMTAFDDFYSTDATQSCSDLFVDNHDASYSDHYHLSTRILPIINAHDNNFTDNDIYELCIQIVSTGATYPNVIDNRSILSFVLFNVPDNMTLRQLDSDNDLLNDYTELYETFTSPFIVDTDNDGWSDYEEVSLRSDPNNYTSKPLVVETLSAMEITQSSARLCGIIVFDSGMPCEVQFKYTRMEVPDLSTFIAMDEAGEISWLYPSDWHGLFFTNDLFDEIVTSLQPGARYVYRAGGRNTDAESWGRYIVFTTLSL